MISETAHKVAAKIEAERAEKRIEAKFVHEFGICSNCGHKVDELNDHDVFGVHEYECKPCGRSWFLDLYK